MLKSLPENIIPIAICGKVPKWYKGLHYKKLAPKYDFFMEWKKNHDNDYYIKCFKEQVLDKLNPLDVLEELYRLADSSLGCDDVRRQNFKIALVCYENRLDFCHRHLVSRWFNRNGIWCEEADSVNIYI